LLSSLKKRRPYRERLQAESAAETLRIERVLATARAFLATTSLVAIWIDATEPSRYSGITYGIMAGFVAYSFFILAWIRWHGKPSASFRLAIHTVDVIWPAVIAVFTDGPSSPFFTFNTFVLLEAAYRWGFRETLATAGAEVLLYFLGALEPILSPGSAPSLGAPDFELNRFIMRGLYLLIMGYLLGYLGEQEKVQRAEVSRIARLMIKVQSETGLRGALTGVLEDACNLFGSDRAVLVLKETSTDRVYVWEAWRDQETQEIAVGSTELDFTQRPEFLFENPARVWFAKHPGHEAPAGFFNLRALDLEGSAFRNFPWSAPAAFLKSRRFNSLLGSEFEFRSDWVGTLLLLDPDLETDVDTALRFLRVLSQQISPAIYSIFVMRRLRSRTGAVERARVARELHDGVIQSVIGLEMQVDVLRRRVQSADSRMGEELARIQALLRQEVLNLRDLMQHIKPMDLGPRQFLDFVAYTVEKFRHETGISAEFVSTQEDVSLAPRLRSEMARIVQEALMNVRKHSGARHAVVRFESEAGTWKLSIDDDGRGFDFSGTLSQADLDSARKGPLVIKERVRALGGQLVVESNPGRGARLEITVPQKSDD
jgi:signal transduction histidine kinase